MIRSWGKAAPIRQGNLSVKSTFSGRLVFLLAAAVSATAFAQMPDHPIITEVHTDPPGNHDGPIGPDGGDLHREFIEIYLPTCAELDPTDPNLDCDSLNLTIYAVEGDASSSGNALVNYRIDLPTFDVDPSTPPIAGAWARPSSGIVVIGWIDYVFSDIGECGDGSVCSVAAADCADSSRCIGTNSGLAGTPSTRVARVNGGVTSTGDYRNSQ